MNGKSDLHAGLQPPRPLGVRHRHTRYSCTSMYTVARSGWVGATLEPLSSWRGACYSRQTGSAQGCQAVRAVSCFYTAAVGTP